MEKVYGERKKIQRIKKQGTTGKQRDGKKRRKRRDILDVPRKVILWGRKKRKRNALKRGKIVAKALHGQRYPLPLS